MPVIVKNGKNHVESMRWGLIPFWAKEMSIGFRMINARAEGIEKKPAYRRPYKGQRCLIPASFFFEWTTIGAKKIPYLIKVKNQNIFSMAGLWDIWQDSNGNEIHNYTIITTKPNKLISKIHDRMPVILSTENEKRWLSQKLVKPDNILGSYSAQKMIMYQVSTLVNKPIIDSVEVTNKLE